MERFEGAARRCRRQARAGRSG